MISARPWIIRSKFLSGLARRNASVLEGLFLFSLARLVDRPKQRHRFSPLKFLPGQDSQTSLDRPRERRSPVKILEGEGKYCR